eukprot:gene14891-1059_t
MSAATPISLKDAAHRETWLDKAQHPNVVDEYTEMVVREAAAAAASATAPATEIRKEEDGSSSAVEAEAAEPPLQTEVRFSHNMGPSEFVHMQLAASVAGLAFKDPASMLSIHPTFGPWLSLRSVVVLDVDGSTIADPTPVKHPRPDVIPKVEARLAELLAPPPAPRPVWTDWLGLRDLVGDFEPATEHRYGEDMLEYHYSYSREALERAVDAAVSLIDGPQREIGEERVWAEDHPSCVAVAACPCPYPCPCSFPPIIPGGASEVEVLVGLVAACVPAEDPAFGIFEGAFVVLGAVLAGNHVVQQNAMADLRKQLLDTQQVLNVMGLKNQIAEMKEDAAAFRSELGGSKQMLAGLKAEASSAAATSAELHGGLTEAEQLLKKLKTHSDTAEEDAAALRAELTTTKKDATDFRTEVEKLEETLEAVKIKVADSHKMSRAKVMEVLNSSPKPNFSGMDLRGLDLSDIDFSGASLHGAKLAGATMDRVRLQNTILSGVDLRGLNLRGADVSGAVFKGALNLKDAKLDNLRGAVLSGVDLRGVDLRGVDLSGADVSRAVFKGALNLKFTKLDNLRGAVLSGVDLSGVDLSGVDVSGAVFKGALNLKDAKLDNLRGADLSGADLSGVDLTGVTGLQFIVLGTGGQHTANVAGCKHGFSHQGGLSKGAIVLVDNVLAKVTRPSPNYSVSMYYTTSSGSESGSDTSSYVVPT